MADETQHDLPIYPPVVAVLGHVDHGKTSLLDTIRESSIVEREHGGITQKIGASSIELMHDGVKRNITFIDTPGHQAFAQMRSRGAQAADIGLLIIASDDGIMPQTKESIDLLKNSDIPYIVVLTKADLQTKNPEKVKQQLLSEGILLEGYGGDIPVIEVSAKTKLNIKELLDLILLVQEVHLQSKVRDPKAPLQAIVIESRLEQKSGARATIVIKQGTLKLRDEVYAENGKFRVRSIMNDLGKMQDSATVGDAVELVGFQTVPTVGSLITATEQGQKEPIAQLSREGISLHANEGDLPIVLVADSQGSLEAITAALSDKVVIVSQKTGEIAEADIMMGKSTGAFVIGFNTKLRSDITKLARTEKVLMKNYTIIYELLDEIADVLEGKALAMMEQVYGQAQILAKFPFEKTFALGVRILEGRLAKGDRARIMRGEEIVGETQISSLRVGKDQISKVEQGNEAGIIITPMLDFQVGDMVISHE